MNLAGTAKASAESHNGSSEVAKKLENDRKSLFVKINMDGIPIGRKVDLKAYDSYDKLSLAVDELFRGLMAGALKISLSSLSGHLNFTCLSQLPEDIAAVSPS